MGCKEIPLIFFSLFSLRSFLILFLLSCFFVMFDSTLFSFQRDNQRIRWRGVSGASIKVWRYCRQILRQNEATEDWRWDNHFRSHQLPSAMLVGTVEESGTFGSISSKLSSVILKGGKIFGEYWTLWEYDWSKFVCKTMWRTNYFSNVWEICRSICMTAINNTS